MTRSRIHRQAVARTTTSGATVDPGNHSNVQDGRLAGCLSADVKQCPVDGTTCELLSGVPEDLIFLCHQDGLLRRRPCNRCRAVEAAGQALTGKRLGQIERTALLTAAGAGAPPSALVPCELTRAEAESIRRAARSLARWGLIEDFGRRSMAQLTPLGEELVRKCGTELRYGRRIRWTRRLPGIIAQVRLPTVALLAEFRRHIEWNLELARRLLQRFSGVNEPDILRNRVDHLALLLDTLNEVLDDVVLR